LADVMKDIKTDLNSVKLTCDCGSKHDFGVRLCGTTHECRTCGKNFVVPDSPERQAFERIEWAVKPLGTHRRMPLAELCHYGVKASRAEYYVGPDDVSYQKLLWPDVSIWVRSSDMDELKRSSKGKRRPFAVVPPTVVPPAGLVAVGVIA